MFTLFQAFHWCLDHDAAAAEFSRILKPGGIVALIWNLEDRSVNCGEVISTTNEGHEALTIDHMTAMPPRG
jgi:ubiquinone/menaquinone biosynthesis C-methylase UbiE